MAYHAGAMQTFRTRADLGSSLRVKLVGNQTVDIAQAGEEGIGFSVARNFSTLGPMGDSPYNDVAILLSNSDGTFEAIADGVIPINTEFYGAAGGRISATVIGRTMGRALEAAAAAGDVIKVIVYPTARA